MIIGNNNNLGSKSAKLMNTLKSQHSNHAGPNNNFGFTEDLSNYSHTSANDEIAMYDKSLAMLKERYQKKLISADEFNKKCKEIGKKKAKALKNKK
ncbi:MAG: hypothetical protein IJF92_03285 [Bacilli bacterium]|nr:hypothetical protein [Bacilli bacterium]